MVVVVLGSVTATGDVSVLSIICSIFDQIIHNKLTTPITTTTNI